MPDREAAGERDVLDGGTRALLDDWREEHRADRLEETRRQSLLFGIRSAYVQASGAEGATRWRGWAAVAMRSRGWFLGALLGALATGGVLWSFPELTFFQQPKDVALPVRAEPPPNEVRAPLDAQRRYGDACVVGRGGNGLLSDFESQSLRIEAVDGRRGQWIHLRSAPEGERSGPLEILANPEAAAGNRFALRVSGPAPTGWGAKLSIPLAHFDCYDASEYVGVRLRARGTLPVFAVLQTRDSVPRQFGGNCEEKCWFSAGRILDLQDQFQTFEVRFDEMRSPNPAVELPRELMFLEFNTQAGPKAYDFWLDDVSLIPKGE